MSKPIIFAICLRELPHHRVEAQKMFDRHTLPVTWIEGINGLNAGIRAIAPHDIMPDGNGVHVHPSVICTCISHVMALTYALMSGAKEFFIMEDDVELIDGFEDKWSKVMASKPKDIKVIQCCAVCVDDKPMRPINEFLEHRYYPFSSVCTWWTREAAEFAVRNIAPFSSPLDIIMALRVFPFLGHAITKERLAWDHSTIKRDWGK